MIYFEEIEKRLFEIFDTNKAKDLAELLNVKQTVYNNWKARNKIPYQELINLCEQKNINLLYLINGIGNQYLLPPEISALIERAIALDGHAFTETVIKFILENSVKQKLKNYDKTQPFLKFFFGERLDKMSSYRIIIKALNNSNIDLETLKIEDAKEILLDIIKNYKLQIVDFINYTLTEKDHTNALKFVETLENLDAYIILMDIKLAIETFNESIIYLTVTPLKQKITGKD